MSLKSEPTHLYQSSIFIKNFRNVHEASLGFGRGHNLFIGPNGHGKTNVLEAIAIACSLKPMQALHNNDLIKFHTEQAKVSASFEGREQFEIDIDIFPQGKKAKKNNRALKTIAELSIDCPLVSFIPAELNLISGAQSLRRRALDQAAAALFLEHALAIRSYEKVLQNRNRLLKDWPLDMDMLKTFSDLLIKEGSHVMYFRLKTIDHLCGLFADMTTKILGAAHSARIAYHAYGEELRNYSVGDLCALLQQHQIKTHATELKRRVTMFGPHLDDLTFLINDNDAKAFASRGQTRALVLSFKLSQMLAIHKIRGHAPIIILDDIVSELDQEIKHNLVSTIAGLETQAFFSTTDRETFGSNLPLDQIFVVDRGKIQ